MARPAARCRARRPPSGRRGRRARRASLGGGVLRLELDGPGLQPREIEQLVDDALQPLALFARGVEQVGLLFGERTCDAVDTEVDRHPQRGERRAELVRHRRHEVVSQLVEAAQPGHVLEHHGGRDDAAPLLVDGSRPRQEDPLAVGTRDGERLVEAARREGALALKHVRAHRLEGIAQRRFEPRQLGRRVGVAREQLLGGAVQAEDRAARREHEHRVGEAVERALRRELRLEHLAERAPAVLGDAVGHRVEGGGELRDLVATAHGRAHREVAAAELLDGLTERRERPDRAGCEHRREREPDCERGEHREDHRGADSLGLATCALALERHGVLVHDEDAVGPGPERRRSAAAARRSSRTRRSRPPACQGTDRDGAGSRSTAGAAPSRARPRRAR